jgi:hypothetical protein
VLRAAPARVACLNFTEAGEVPRDPMKRTPMIPLNPKYPERVCWGCDKYCPADDLRCGNGTIRTPHPKELFGFDLAHPS